MYDMQVLTGQLYLSVCGLATRTTGSIEPDRWVFGNAPLRRVSDCRFFTPGPSKSTSGSKRLVTSIQRMGFDKLIRANVFLARSANDKDSLGTSQQSHTFLGSQKFAYFAWGGFTL